MLAAYASGDALWIKIAFRIKVKPRYPLKSTLKLIRYTGWCKNLYIWPVVTIPPFFVPDLLTYLWLLHINARRASHFHKTPPFDLVLRQFRCSPDVNSHSV